jgi:hypothetical protein
MSTSDYTLVSGQQTDGTWTHTGRLVVSFKMPSGQVVTLTLPDDWLTLKASIPNSLEDLTYGG